jgi:hypothetical protein
MANHTECWKYQNIHLRMPKKSKKVLVEYWVSTSIWVKECGVKVSISKQHGDRASKYW